MKTFPATLLIVSLLGLAPRTAQGEVADEIEVLPEMEITIQRYRQPKEDAASPVVVIDRQELDALGGTNVRDILRGVPGIDVRPQGSAGAQTGVSIRGSRTEQILVLIDGKRVNTAQGGGVDLSDIPLYDVERIEILKGGGSALYGSDPVGGVINVVTRRGGDGRFETRLQVGSFGTWGLDLGTGESLGRGSYRVDAQRFYQYGDFDYEDNAGADQQRANNYLRRDHARVRGSYDLGRSGELSGDLAAFQAVKGVPGRLSFPTPAARQRDFRFDAGLEHRVDLGRSGELTSRAYWQEQTRDFEDPTGAFPIDSSHDNSLQALEVIGSLAAAGSGRTVLGLDLRRDAIDSTDDGRHERLTAGLFGLHELDLGPVLIVPSARLDAQTGQAMIFSPKLAVAGQPTRTVKLRAQAGRSFRAPSFDDLYWPADAFATGNPNLLPEHAIEFGFGVDWTPSSRTRVALDYYNRASDDLIVWLPGLGGKYQPQNLASVRFQGLETSFEVPVPVIDSLQFRGSYTWLKATTHSGTAAEIGKQLVGHPQHAGRAGLRYRDGGWLADLEVIAVGERFTTAANTQTLPSYALVEATARWQATERDEFALELHNLFDTDYRTVLDYPLPGFEARFSASRRF